MRTSNEGQPGSANRALREFLATETAAGALLVVAAVVALTWANSPWHASYERFWQTDIGIRVGATALDLDLRHWVNEGLMAVFFLVVGLEVKRELLLGELRDRRSAALPVFGALGGMLLPALVYLAINSRGDGGASRGWGVPMATDIAFAIGVLALVAPRIPPAARLFLLTLAIVDDIGAIMVIAVFYSPAPDVRWLLLAACVVLAVVFLTRAGFRATPLFGFLGVALWVAVHGSGVHATLAGVAMGLLAPATPALDRHIIRSRTDQLLDVFTPQSARETTRLARLAVSELEWLEHGLHSVASLLIVPLFALANTGVVLSTSAFGDAISSPVAIGVACGLVVGKAAGISGGAWVATRLGLAALPDGVRWRHVVGAASLGGIGFTVSIFISNLAFRSPLLVSEAKIGILAASLFAGAAGAVVLRGATTVSHS